jgi:OmpA-OmpF porin, OOP family
MQKLAKFSVLLCGTVLGSLAQAGAQQPPAGIVAENSGTNGYYLRLGGGGAWPAAPGGYAQSLGPTTSNVSTGFIVGGAAGYKANAWRGELELEYLQVGVKSISFLNSGTTINTTGSQSNLAGMVNGYYDIATGTPFVPYVGLGVGIADLSMNGVNNAASGHTILNTSTVTFALQGMVGVQYLINEKWSAGAEFRYFKTPDGWFVNGDGLQSSVENAQYNLLVGVSYHFGASK